MTITKLTNHKLDLRRPANTNITTNAPQTATVDSEPNSGTKTPEMYTSIICWGELSARALFAEE